MVLIAKVFGVRKAYRFMVDADGTVRVYDSVAGYYTTCHSMSEAAMRRVRKAAMAAQEVC